MSGFWYYLEGSETCGPVTFDELTKVLSHLPTPRDVLVWREGFTDWMAAENVREIVEKLFRPPPLSSRQSVMPPPLPERGPEMASEASSTERVPLKKWSLWRAALYGFLFGVLAFVINNAANGWNELLWFQHGRPGQIVGYFGGRFLFLPLLFVVVASIRNRFSKT